MGNKSFSNASLIKLLLITTISFIVPSKAFSEEVIFYSETNLKKEGCGDDTLLPFTRIEDKRENKRGGFFLFTVYLDDIEKEIKDISMPSGWELEFNSGDYYYKGEYFRVFEEKENKTVDIVSNESLSKIARFSPYREKTKNKYNSLFGNIYPDLSHLHFRTESGTIVYPGRLRQFDHISDRFETWMLYEMCEMKNDHTSSSSVALNP